MIFLKCNQNELHINAKGYAYPTSNVTEDLNWLDVSVSGSYNGKVFQKRDVCLRTEEISELVDWFRSISKSPKSTISFMEPSLSFTVDNNQDTLSVELRYGLSPNKDDSPFTCTFRLSELDLSLIEDSISRTLFCFPSKDR